MSGFTDRLIASMAGGLVVSCQAYPGEPLRHPETMAQMAAAVEVGAERVALLPADEGWLLSRAAEAVRAPVARGG